MKLRTLILLVASLTLFYVGISLAFAVYGQYFVTMSYWVYSAQLRYPVFLALGWIILIFIAAYSCMTLALITH